MKTLVFLFGLVLVLCGSADAQFNNGQSVGSPGFSNSVASSSPLSNVMVTQDGEIMLTQDGQQMITE